MKILGIESSCDETAVAIVDGERNILAHNILSQIAEHSPFGGVVPEIAARSHLSFIEDLINTTLKDANLTLEQIDGIAVTAGPGLIGGVIVGVMVAKALAAVTQKPFLAINHLEGHALTCRLTHDVDYPFLLLLVSGGHCQILLVKNLANYELLGSTMDDSIGEAFDKVAKMMDLGYPGGPEVEQKALKGDPFKYNFPKSMVGKDHLNFSFSGLKTAVKRTIDSLTSLTEQDINDICASFQYTCGEIIKDRIIRALEHNIANNIEVNVLVVAGGVAANKYLQNILAGIANNYNIELIAPPLKLCTDNAAMIAWAGVERLKSGLINDLSFEPMATWPLEKLNVLS
ncbi:tRNA (adenosine(37)-N6)-threonylcarbamoyltransferase complex transferase subunit TsaD [Rickettsiales endosymbiont of Stachyamoeba lipophora]|uniref:tRNA (adenosine(37)-N6)-threonylcarbamoyltransferase complex transferase subunit TsaD n=1 Tax=Rickettsiales endosymbiont of Stachyamoeba lipophora TaxID=2486578 RepID=UPI000F6460C3|nr:tRNA (adenosine(37)-N6)-threonylcarbamoyltransferase complex transferase subunit TsaD [Rickettsiales endosymbiont of Stachyamoeba lipophora]AZL16430.1 tRNA (adenosine(37)-N6)-threonylcarbamoyltransferase complex transferase subunit TsaD [Rickettsiales endosymbiont of Stachyamoeba lipophora]